MKIIKSKKMKILILAIAVATVGTLASVLAFGADQKEDPSSRLREYKASVGDITVGVDASAMVAYDQTKYSFNVEGKIGKLFVAPGDIVKKGDKLAEISEESLNEQLQKLMINQQKASINLADAKDSQKLGALTAKDKLNESALSDGESKLTLAEAELAVNEAENNLTLADRNVRDLKDELEDAEDNDDGSDESESAIKKLKSDLYTARQESERAGLILERANLALEKVQLKQKQDKENKTDTESLSQAEYDITLRRLANTTKLAQLDLNQINLEIEQVKEAQNNRVLAAQKDGIIISIDYAEGDAVNQKSTIVVGDLETTQLVAMVEQSDIGKLKPDQLIDLHLEAYPDNLLTGKINKIHYLPEKSGNSVFYKVYFTLDATDLSIHEGMTGEVTFIIKKKDSVLKLSNKAITLRDGKQYVTLQGEDGSTYETEITTGFSDGRFSEVLSGLSDGQTVVVKDKAI